ncbi:hypothetical protein DPMN_019522 [Dreissena polymorpha]|uniref:G-protein coupled receptors family 1 profile domain-containing protein n=1 Tax=Dreissena polymorpha TaxID=45954 RepID=A0A9D4RRL4_DREPO|nr:hypothetical protein DPMN_002274 [Dreissena polymorpha]KAH3895359.1 hypothetical protein DPMN_019522 [Dreissena polymorpha]
MSVWANLTLTSANDSHVSVTSGDLNWAVLLLGVVVVFGITGNVMVCMAISLEKRLQTVTNYFLLSLAVTDLLVCLLVMPLSIIDELFGKAEHTSMN